MKSTKDFTIPTLPAVATETVRQVLLQSSKAQIDDCPTPKDADREFADNQFAWCSSQVNTDLALAAHCEFEGDLHEDEDAYLDLYRSPMYRKLRDTFVEEGAKGNGKAFINAIWRAYNAGRLSSDRLIPDTREVREARRMTDHLALRSVS